MTRTDNTNCISMNINVIHLTINKINATCLLASYYFLKLKLDLSETFYKCDDLVIILCL